jgi:ankyrin repeat protein
MVAYLCPWRCIRKCRSQIAESMEGCYPLDLACSSGAGDRVISLLLDHFLEAASIPGLKGRLPLRQACFTKDMQPEIVRLFLSVYPDKAGVQDKLGSLPLHLACGSKASSDDVELLLSAYPQGVSLVNNSGRLPLQVACGTHANVDVITSCISRGYRNTSGSSLSLHFACSCKASESVIMTQRTNEAKPHLI